LANITRFPFSSFIHELHSNEKYFFSNVSKESLFEELLQWKDDADGGQTLDQLITTKFPRVDLEVIKNIFTDNLRDLDSGLRFIHFILNCSLDVRVLDYVLRDSHHLGISEANCVDLEELFKHVCFHNSELAIKSAGLSCVEQIVALRYWLFNRVYWNRPNRCLASMIRYVLLELHEKDKKFQRIMREKCLRMSKDEMLTFFMNRGKSIKHVEVQKVCSMLQRDRPILFRDVLQINRALEDATMTRICESLSHLTMRQLYALQNKINMNLAEGLNRPTENCLVLLDYPMESGRLKLGEDINVITYSGSSIRLDRLSGIVEGAARGFKDHLQRVRVFLDPLIAKECDGRKIEQIREMIIKELSCIT
jgi:HD superfamily phosphohydrolase